METIFASEPHTEPEKKSYHSNALLAERPLIHCRWSFTSKTLREKFRAGIGIAIAVAGLAVLLGTGCDTMSDQQLAGLALGASAPYSQDPSAGQAAAFLGNSLVAADNADRSRSQVNVNVNGQSSQEQSQIQARQALFNGMSFTCDRKPTSGFFSGKFKPEGAKVLFKADENFYAIVNAGYRGGFQTIIKNANDEIVKQGSYAGESSAGSWGPLSLSKPGKYVILWYLDGKLATASEIVIIE